MVNKSFRICAPMRHQGYTLIGTARNGGVKMIEGNALRHQMVLPQQQKIYDYWRSKCSADKFPSRHEIFPEDIGKQLPTTTLTEVVAETGRYRIRLAGTGFWNLFDSEIQGRHIDELPMGCRNDYWKNVLDNVVKHRRPYAGVTRPGTPNGSHLAQFWIRLPLADIGKNVTMILGYDHFVKMEAQSSDSSVSDKLYA